MESLQFLLNGQVGKEAYLEIRGSGQVVVTILAVRPPVQLPPASDLNALGIAIETRRFTVLMRT
jgi:hypothetical protein